MEYALAILFVGAFGWLSRMSGGGWPKLPWGLDQHLWAIPYGILGGGLAHYGGFGWASTTGAVGLSYLTAFFAKRTGHGTYMTLPYSIKTGLEPERLDFIVKYFFGRDPRFVPKEFPRDVLVRNIMKYGEKKLMYRNLTGLFVTGMGVSLGAMIVALCTGHPVIAILLFASAGCKTLAYYIGYKIVKDPTKPLQTEIGEILTGIFAGIGIAISALMIWKKKDNNERSE